MSPSASTPPSARKQILAIGLEVGTFEFIRAALDAGELPVLASLAARGGVQPMSTVTEISSGSIWPSFATGTNPLKNGQFFTHMQLESGSYRSGNSEKSGEKAGATGADKAAGGRIERFEIVLPVTGTYGQLRAFLKRALGEIPVLSLDQMTLKRQSRNDAEVQAELKMTLHLVKP